MSKKIRQEVLKLIEEKEKLENEISELTQILTKNNVGMSDPLVDEEGFPLAHVDIYQVRHARHTIICKQNDHKEIMKRIEEGVSQYYQDSDVQNTALLNAMGHMGNDAPEYTEPFARVHVVNPGSPADAAGIQEGDLVIEFGSVNAKNFRNMNDIGTIVKHSVGHKVNMKIKRNDHMRRVIIVPKEWTGQGLLGCHVVPL